MAVEVYDLQTIISGQAMSLPCVVALGTFDGVHLGHIAILNQVRSMAATFGIASVVFTFDRQPLEYLRPTSAPPLIMSSAERIAMLAKYTDRVIVTPFCSELAAIQPYEFVQQVLIQGLHCRGVAAGFNYSFGQGATGKTAQLVELGNEAALTVSVVPPVMLDGQPISSSLIRTLVREGKIATANRLLGRPFSLSGRVVSGDARGRQLGYPTANVASDSRLLIPGDGVYVTEFWTTSAQARQRIGSAVTAVSNRPTFAGSNTSVESFVIDYQGDLYGAEVSVLFLHRLRDIQKFDTPQALQMQIEADVATARQLFPASRLQP